MLVRTDAHNTRVYKDTKINQSKFNQFGLNDYQVFLTLISKINFFDEHGNFRQDENIEGEYELTAQEFSSIFKSSFNNSYMILKRSIQKIRSSYVVVPDPYDAGIWEINVCSMAKYIEKEGKLLFKFNRDFLPYLRQVHERFIIYSLKDISNFSSLYTVRLYELMQEFKDTGYMVKSIEQLKTAFAVGNNYKRYSHFKEKTFKRACDEINSRSDPNIDHYWNIRFEEEKKGAAVVAIKFFFNPVSIVHLPSDKAGKHRTRLVKKPKPALKFK